MAQTYIKRKLSVLLGITTGIAILLMVIVGAAQIVTSAAKLLALPLSYPATTAVVVVICALWIARAAAELSDGKLNDD